MAEFLSLVCSRMSPVITIFASAPDRSPFVIVPASESAEDVLDAAEDSPAFLDDTAEDILDAADVEALLEVAELDSASIAAAELPDITVADAEFSARFVAVDMLPLVPPRQFIDSNITIAKSAIARRTLPASMETRKGDIRCFAEGGIYLDKIITSKGVK